MGVQIGRRQAVRPANTVDAPEEYFYASEARTVLGLHSVEYRQLRDLLAIVRNVESQDIGVGWARYSLADIAGMHVAIRLVGGREAFEPGRRMRLAPLREAIKALRDMGVRHPLLEVPMAVHEGRVVAHVRGLLVDPATGQGLLSEVHELLIETLKASDVDAAASIARLRSELIQLRRVPSKTAGRLEAQIGLTK